MSSSTSVLTYNLVGIDPNQTLVGSVISADSTATALLLNCPSGTDSDDCGIYNASVTFGPWALATPPPSASTGTYDMHITEAGDPDATGTATADAPWTFNVHCQVVSTTQINVCTTTNIGGNNDGTPTATLTNPDPTDYGATKIPITITGGLEKLAAASSSTSGSGSGSGSTSASGSGSGSGSSTGTSAAATGSHTGAASNVYGVNIGTLGLFGLLTALLIR
ncbi:hypothetical protein K461DRAFT_295713 [Myriangium duriaei CBS 260.36]|uniref:Uncharacterized protein n=1 Tax=Myriangium duriaei CBS 260.36 TaxID=1168546 RepID=A0A9P4IZA6_9PEZI|nr:hypothetical protein K461DRAFT_295713 [Myriangium duriaei CBS 260.36]